MEDAPKILVVVLVDGTEICKKLFQLRSATEIIDTCKRLLPCAAEYKRILKFNADFNEFIDIDLDDNIQNLDKFQVLFKSIKVSGAVLYVLIFFLKIITELILKVYAQGVP